MTYYYNTVPGIGKCRNNLVYTSIIDNNKFICHYTVDQLYHNDNCLPIDILNEKYQRDAKFTKQFAEKFPQHVPTIIDIDNNKIIYEYADVDFWQQADCDKNNFDKILPDWQEQMLEILAAYRACGIWKYSLHPSSYFVIDGKLRSINHFFCYSDNEPQIEINDIINIISDDRKQKLLDFCKLKNIDIKDQMPFSVYGQIALESFRSNYPNDFIDKAKQLYK